MIDLTNNDGILQALAFVRGTIRRYRGRPRRVNNITMHELSRFCEDTDNWETLDREEFRKWWNDE